MVDIEDDQNQNSGSGDEVIEVPLEGNPKILIVDDEELMREVTSIMIEDRGGEVFTACDGMEAVEVFGKHKDEISCICMDFSMPRMNGYEAYQEIVKIKPAVHFIMISGLSITPEVEDLRKQGAITFLAKPFNETTLIKTINAVHKQ
ncbi:response regulator [Oligoflexia bacterium]|nr:response regulator [Oligoflexia bacterium]